MNNKLVAIAVALMVAVVFLVSISSGDYNSSNSNDGSSSGGKTFSVTSSQSDTVGWVNWGEDEYGSMTLNWVFVITDSTLTNNGTCIDKAGTYCKDDNDGSRERMANVNYRYGAAIDSTEDNEVVAAASIVPIYCNKDEVLADLSQFRLKEYAERTDYTCGKASLSRWSPTDSFIVMGSTYLQDESDIDNAMALNIYDTHMKWTYTSTKSDTGLSTSLGPEFSSNEIKDQPFLKSYDLVFTEI